MKKGKTAHEDDEENEGSEGEEASGKKGNTDFQKGQKKGKGSSSDQEERELHVCLCCGYLTVSGAYDICEVCGWEADGLGGSPERGQELVMISGANRNTLVRAQQDFMILEEEERIRGGKKGQAPRGETGGEAAAQNDANTGLEAVCTRTRGHGRRRNPLFEFKLALF